jgi:hypothetical protein
MARLPIPRCGASQVVVPAPGQCAPARSCQLSYARSCQYWTRNEVIALSASAISDISASR